MLLSENEYLVVSKRKHVGAFVGGPQKCEKSRIWELLNMDFVTGEMGALKTGRALGLGKRGVEGETQECHPRAAGVTGQAGVRASL